MSSKSVMREYAEMEMPLAKAMFSSGIRAKIYG